MSLNLDDFNKLGALMSNDSDASPAGKILKLSINLIDEDPEQPRTETNPGFSEESISELASPSPSVPSRMASFSCVFNDGSSIGTESSFNAIATV